MMAGFWFKPQDAIFSLGKIVPEIQINAEDDWESWYRAPPQIVFTDLVAMSGKLGRKRMVSDSCCRRFADYEMKAVHLFISLPDKRKLGPPRVNPQFGKLDR